jgi:Ca-activated chloride channel family protein
MSRIQASGFRCWVSGWSWLTSALAILFAIVFLFAFVIASSHEPRTLNPLSLSFWLTPDQQGDRLMRRGEFGEAAQRYRDPLRRGVALYRAGEFKNASHTFGRVKTAEGQFNRGNALVMQGKYTEAIEAYDAALEARPGWPEAETNREIARLRAEKLKQEGGDMTGGMLAADEIVFTSGKEDVSGQEQTSEGGDQLMDQALQAMWLRRIQTKPADFLKAKFAYQLSHEEGQ